MVRSRSLGASSPVAASLPPEGLPGLRPGWSRLVTAPDAAGVPRTWHLLDNLSELESLGATPTGTILCVHGNPTWSYLWRTVLAAATDAAGATNAAGAAAAAGPVWRVIAVDQLEMGFSERSGRSRGLPERIADLGSLTDTLGLQGPVVTLGHDWGGVVSLGWAVDHPDALAGVMLLNTAVHQPESEPLPAALRLVLKQALLATATVRTTAFLDTTLAIAHPPLAPDIRRAFRAPYLSAARRAGIGAFVADIPVDAAHPSFAELTRVSSAVARLDVPALLLWGPRDPVFSDRYLGDLIARLPHADVTRFETAGHLVGEDIPVAPLLLSWLAERFSSSTSAGTRVLSSQKNRGDSAPPSAIQPQTPQISSEISPHPAQDPAPVAPERPAPGLATAPAAAPSTATASGPSAATTPAASMATAPGAAPSMATIPAAASSIAPAAAPPAASAPPSALVSAPGYRPLWAALDELADSTTTALVEMAPRGGVGPRVVSWRLLARRVAELAAGLRAVGVKPGDRVSLLVPPGADLTAVVYACLRLGAVIVVADAGLGIAGLGRAVRGARPQHIIGIEPALAAAKALGWPGQRISATTLAAPLAAALGVTHSLPAVARLGRAHPGTSATANGIASAISSVAGTSATAHASAPPSANGAAAPSAGAGGAAGEPAPDDVAAILFTSGSTGPAKGVVYTHRQLSALVGVLGQQFDLGVGSGLVAGFAPFALLGPALGATSVTPDMDVTSPKTLTASAVADATRAADASVIFASPAALTSVLATSSALTLGQRRALARVKTVLSAGAPLAVTLLERLQGLVPEAAIHTPYGMTEGLLMTDITLAGILESATDGDPAGGVCVGSPVPGVHVGISALDADGRATGPVTEASRSSHRGSGPTGEIVVSAPHLKDHYDQLWATDREATRAVPDDRRRWHRTGDVGHLDADGRLWVEGRLPHVITTPDGPLTPVRPEQAVERLDTVKRAAVVGIGPRGTQQIVAVVELDSTLTQAAATPSTLVSSAPSLTPGVTTPSARAGTAPPSTRGVAASSSTPLGTTSSSTSSLGASTAARPSAVARAGGAVARATGLASGVHLADAELSAEVRRVTGLPVVAVLVVDELPTDVRHNSKIDRTALAAWAAAILAGGPRRSPTRGRR